MPTRNTKPSETRRSVEVQIRDMAFKRRGFVTVRDLKNFLAGPDISDDAILVVSADDHSYRRVKPEVATALDEGDGGELTEDFGEETTPEKEYGKRINIILFA